jgi:serine/threonine protein kinase
VVNVYSTELKNIVTMCLQVNPDRRPKTVELFNHPVVRLMLYMDGIIKREVNSGLKVLQKKFNKELRKKVEEIEIAHITVSQLKLKSPVGDVESGSKIDRYGAHRGMG